MNRLPKGIGVWTEQLSDLTSDVEALAQEAAHTGLGHIAVRCASGFEERDHDLNRALALALRPHGIELWVWPYCGYHADADEATCRSEGEFHARIALSVGAVGSIADIETDDSSKAYAYKPANATAYMQGFRSVAPDLGLGMTSYWLKGSHDSMPWTELLASAWNAPQVYWTIAEMDPARMLAASLESFAGYQSGVHPLGGDAQASPLTGDAIRAFAAACRSRGLNSFGLYHWAGTIDWPALVAVCADGSSAPSETNPEEANPLTAPVVRSQDVSGIALEVAQYRLAHLSAESCTLHGRTFDLVDPGRCGYFVVDSIVAAGNAAGVDLSDLPWYADNARESNDKLAQFAASAEYGIRKVSIEDAIPGCVVAFTTPGVGHIALYVGAVEGTPTVAENTTSSRGRGHPGTGLTAWDDLASTVEALYQVFPDAAPTPVPAGELKVVYPADAPHAAVVPCNPVEKDGVTRVDLAPLCQALGYDALYRQTPDGPRIYIKPKPSSST